MEKPEVSKVFLYSIMSGMLITGTANTLIGKYVDIQQAPAESGIEGRCFNFTHPYLQTTVMFAGELLCFVFLAIKIQLDRRAARQLEIMSPGANLARQIKMKTNINPLLLAIPASCDVCGTSLMFVALTMVPASVYQMMRGLIVPITALMSVVFLKKRQYRHHVAGIILIITGVFLVGYVSVAGSKSDGASSGSELFGIFLLIVSQCFTGTMFIVEEKLLGDYYLEPFHIVGTEGMWGLAYYIMLLPIM
jgi:drug/metabolite transporter (DMT)-like permease